jgi:hypothetical protein
MTSKETAMPRPAETFPRRNHRGELRPHLGEDSQPIGFVIAHDGKGTYTVLRPDGSRTQHHAHAIWQDARCDEDRQDAIAWTREHAAAYRALGIDI